jgi:hypothetical protein
MTVLRTDNDNVVLVLSRKDAAALLGSLASAERGREDFEYLVSQDAGDYEAHTIPQIRESHRQEIEVEARIRQTIVSQTEPVKYELRSPNQAAYYGQFATAEIAEQKRTELELGEEWQVTPTYVPTAIPRVYIDVETSQLPEQEMQNILAAPPVARDHEYGAWVNVPPADADWSADDLNPEANEEWADFPHLNAVLLAARELGANWVNFDADGFDHLAGLPTFTW